MKISTLQKWPAALPILGSAMFVAFLVGIKLSTPVRPSDNPLAVGAATGPATQPGPAVVVTAATPPKPTGPIPAAERLKVLRFATGPASAPEFILNQTRRTYNNAIGNRTLDLNALTAANVLPPLQNYILNSTDVLANKGLETSLNAGFRYFVEAGGNAIATGDLRAGPTGAITLISFATGGAALQPAVDALNKLAAMDQVKKGSYEPRIVTAASNISLTVIWLVSDNGAPDLIYPLVTPSTAVPALRVYPADDFLKQVRPLINTVNQGGRRGGMGGGGPVNPGGPMTPATPGPGPRGPGTAVPPAPARPGA